MVEQRLHVAAVDKFHDQEVAGIGFSDVEDLDDVCVLQEERDLGLV